MSEIIEVHGLVAAVKSAQAEMDYRRQERIPRINGTLQCPRAGDAGARGPGFNW
jgi:hypothetical protein